MLSQLLPADMFSLLLVFARIGSAVMLLPGFGETYVSPRVRLLFATALTLVITPVVMATVPKLPATLIELTLIVGGEIGIGLFLGGMVRMMISTLHISGTIIGFQTSLGAAQVFDPANAQQGTVIGAFFNVIGIFLIFISDMHHLMLIALTESYTAFVPGAPPPMGDITQAAVLFVSRSFLLAMQIAAPFLVVGLIFYIGLGLIARLMPQMQVFFIAMPLQITIGFLLMILTFSAGMYWFLEYFQTSIQGLFSMQ